MKTRRYLEPSPTPAISRGRSSDRPCVDPRERQVFKPAVTCRSESSHQDSALVLERPERPTERKRANLPAEPQAVSDGRAKVNAGIHAGVSVFSCCCGEAG